MAYTIMVTIKVMLELEVECPEDMDAEELVDKIIINAHVPDRPDIVVNDSNKTMERNEMNQSKVSYKTLLPQWVSEHPDAIRVELFVFDDGKVEVKMAGVPELQARLLGCKLEEGRWVDRFSTLLVPVADRLMVLHGVIGKPWRLMACTFVDKSKVCDAARLLLPYIAAIMDAEANASR